MTRKALFSILISLATVASLTGGASESQATCSANQICNVGPGYYVSCSGSTTCTSTATYVECDGVRKNCPSCYVQRTCPSGATVSCFGWSSCSQAFARVTCDGTTHVCPPITPLS